mmetsp:Transcript_18733/g.43158  ORF Transcript_18733/g.43158 Transcript_18733/m.43158 type:complete len:255 (-) Transcript_18733:637-1401(-)
MNGSFVVLFRVVVAILIINAAVIRLIVVGFSIGSILALPQFLESLLGILRVGVGVFLQSVCHLRFGSTIAGIVLVVRSVQEAVRIAGLRIVVAGGSQHAGRTGERVFARGSAAVGAVVLDVHVHLFAVGRVVVGSLLERVHDGPQNTLPLGFFEGRFGSVDLRLLLSRAVAVGGSGAEGSRGLYQAGRYGRVVGNVRVQARAGVRYRALGIVTVFLVVVVVVVFFFVVLLLTGRRQNFLVVIVVSARHDRHAHS